MKKKGENEEYNDLAVQIAKIKTILEEVVVPGIKRSGKKWDETDLLNLPELKELVVSITKKATKLENEHEKLKKHVLERIKLCFILIFLMFSVYSKSILVTLKKAVGLSKMLGL